MTNDKTTALHFGQPPVLFLLAVHSKDSSRLFLSRCVGRVVRPGAVNSAIKGKKQNRYTCVGFLKFLRVSTGTFALSEVLLFLW